MSEMHSIPTWTEANRSLHDAICQARLSVEAAEGLQQLLQSNKERFIDLLDNIPKDSTHRSQLNSGKLLLYRWHKVDLVT